MKNQELRELSKEELIKRGRELRTEIFNLRMQKSVGQLENLFQIKNLRKEIARIETILTSRRKQIAQAKI
jgi:large subunit ribosomal protein L29